MIRTKDDVVKLMARAYKQALKSNDPSSQNGAVILDYQHQAHGYNHYVIEGTEKLPRPDKYDFVTHAEEHCCRAASLLLSPHTAKTMVCPWAACAGCARDIYWAGVKVLWVHSQRMELTPERWKPEIDRALQMMTRLGIEIHYLDTTDIPMKPILVDGELWTCN